MKQPILKRRPSGVWMAAGLGVRHVLNQTTTYSHNSVNPSKRVVLGETARKAWDNWTLVDLDVREHLRNMGFGRGGGL